MRAAATRLAPFAALALAGCPDGLSAFTYGCLPPEACPPGATCVCPDAGETDGGGGTTSSSSSGASSGTSGGSSSGSSGHTSSGGTTSHSGSSGSSSGRASTSGSSTSSGSSACGGGRCGADAGPDAGDPCNPGPAATPVAVLAGADLVLGLAVRDGALYYTDFYGSGMNLYRHELDGGGLASLLGTIPLTAGVSYYGNNVLADAAHVYWTSDYTYSAQGEVAEILLDGGSQKALATGQPGGPVALAVDATNLYWADQGTGDGGSIWKVPLAGGTPVLLASATDPYYLAVDATSVYWSELSTGVYRVGIDGGTVSTIAPINYGGAGIAVDANNVYFGFDESIEASSLDAGVITVLANNQVYPQGMILDGTTLYWTNSGNGIDAGSLMKLPLGCLEPIELVGNLASSSPPIVDATSVYWASNTYPPYEILRVPK